MVEKLMVEVYLPAAGRTFEVRLPAGLRIRAAGMLLSMLLSAMQGPVRGLAVSLDATISGLARALQAVADQKAG